jgi:hypothetical protein
VTVSLGVELSSPWLVVVNSDGCSEVEKATVVVAEGARLDVTVLELPLGRFQSLQPE